MVVRFMLKSFITLVVDMPSRITLVRYSLFVAHIVTYSTVLGADPCSELAHAKSFSFGATVIAGKVVSGEKAFSQVLNLPDPAHCFKELMNRGNAEGKMYALVGLRESDPAQFKIEVGRLKGQRFTVVTLATEQKGVSETQWSEAVLKQIGDGVFRRAFELNKKYR